MKQYEKYKSSGIEWLGDIPEHWEVKRVKDLAEYQSGYFIEAEEIEIDDKYAVYGGNGLRGFTYKYNHNGEYILIGRQGALCGNINYVTGKFWATEHAVVVYSKKGIHKRWYAYLLEIMNLNQYAISAAQPGLSVEKIRRLMLPYISFTEQTAIANYLDTKTAAIDRKIELLTAKADKYKALRRSLINETVCRGLNPNAPLKDSGIEWVGMIPEHWEVKRVKEIFYIGRGRVIGQDELVDEGIFPVFSSQTENNGCLGYIDTFDFNTTLLTWTTDGANAGTLFKREGKFNCTNVCGTLKPKKRKENLDFILYVLQIAAKHNKRIDTNGAKIMNNEMSVIPLLYPPIEEQNEIANYLNVKTTQIDTILTNINNQINKLTQLRKTLINDVVTGKIKVTE